MGYMAWLPHLDNLSLLLIANIVPSTEDADYPIENVINPKLTETYRSTGTSLTITIDTLNQGPITLVALANHNLSATASVTLDAGATTGYGGYTAQMTWREFLMFKYTVTNISLRYWRITITDASNADGYIEIGYLFFGAVIKYPYFGWLYGGSNLTEYTNLELESPCGVMYSERMYHKDVFTLDFGPLNETSMGYLLTLYRSVQTGKYPFLLIPDLDLYEGYYVRIISRFDQKLHVQVSTSQRYVQLILKEDSYGKRI